MKKRRKLMSNFIGKTLFGINVFFAFFLLLSYLSAFLPSNKFWYINVLGLAYPFLVVINLCFVVFWTLLKKKKVLLSIIAIAIGWNYIWQHVQVSFVQNHNCDLRVMSYNIQGPLNEKIINDNSSFWKMIDSLNPDIVCFQELYHLNSGFSHYKNHYPNTRELQFVTQKINNGLQVCSKYPSIEAGRLQYYNFFAIYHDLATPKDTLRVYNIQLVSNYLTEEKQLFDSIRTLTQDQQLTHASNILQKLTSAYKIRAVQVNLFVEHLKSSPYPLLLCGDLNETPLSYSYQKLSTGLTDAFCKKGVGLGNTHNEKLPPIRIDYLLHSPLYKTNFFNTVHVDFSDHFPIIMGITQRETASTSE